jgi:hypothetical protein
MYLRENFVGGTLLWDLKDKYKIDLENELLQHKGSEAPSPT